MRLGAIVLAISAIAPSSSVGLISAFEDYPAGGPYVVAKPKVDLLSHPQAKHFRTVLTRAAKQGPNFAGHFRLVEWGCGTGCSQVAIVNLLSGKVSFPPELNTVGYPIPVEDVFSERYGLIYRLDSRLLVVNGVAGPVQVLGAHYFQLSDGVLVSLRVIAWDSEWNKQTK